MASAPPDSLSEVLFGKSRRAILRLFFTRPDETFHLRQVARLSGVGVGPAQRELAALTGAGILHRQPRGRQVDYRLDRSCPVFAELQALVLKTVGLADVLRDALAPLRGRLHAAFVFGSFARGQQTRDSDVDLLVVGDATFAELASALREPQARLGRVVNPTVYSVKQFRRKRAAGSPFLDRVLDGPKLMIVGDEDELQAMAAERVAAAPRAEPAGNRRAVRGHRQRLGRKQHPRA
jgi:predicted nucleotidyltransferase